ncbi:cation:dicarboxylate symporter family transporter, partial [Marisediminitalea sp.]|uniref:cation:dicarboxylate symporter family transporter n=1 Tax=Marisediminitalea sp. TaxID=2662268 RepID=UPI003514DA01
MVTRRIITVFRSSKNAATRLPASPVMAIATPSNPINALAQGNMLQIIVFAVLLGVAMAMTGDAGKRVAAVFEDLNTVIMR